MDYLALVIPGGETITQPSKIPGGGIKTVAIILRNGFTILIIITIILTLIFLVLGGIQWITSGGEKEKIQGARSKLTYAVIGLVVALSSFFIISIMGFIFGVNLLDFKTD